MIGPLEEVMNKTFPKSTESHTLLPLLLPRGKPDPGQIETDRADLATLILHLQKIRDDIGELLNLQQIRDKLNNIITSQNRISRFVRTLQEDALKRFFVPQVQAAEITLAKKAKGKVKHTIDWNVYTDNLNVMLAAPAASGLKIPASM